MTVYAWSLWDQHVPIERIIEPGYTLCYAARWLDKREIMFDSIRNSKPDKMIAGVHRLLDEADAVCHYNGRKFDIPVLTGEFIQRGMKPPAPFKQIDLLQTMRGTGFPSKKLDYVTQRLGLGQKTKHKGMELWKACIAGDRSAWATMERYNKQDVRLLGKLHDGTADWTLISGGQPQHWSSQGATRDVLLGDAGNSMVDHIGKQLNVIGAGPSEGKLWISGLTSATDYANLLATLQADPSVKQVTTLGAENDAVLLDVKASVPMSGLAANLAAGGRLLLQGEPHPGADANLRWLSGH